MPPRDSNARATAKEEKEASAQRGTFVLGARYQDSPDPVRVRRRAICLLSLVACIDDFDWRLSSDCLSRARFAPILAEGPFEDVLVKVPVHGDARLEASLTIVPIADRDHAAVEMRLDGSVQLECRGQSRGMLIDSQGVTNIHAIKSVFLNCAGLTCLPATCKADTSLEIKDIAQSRRRLFNRFTEQLARQRVLDSQEETETECSQHVAGAICAGFDREVDSLVEIVNAALRDHLQAASESCRAQWQRVHFETEPDGLRFTRQRDSSAESLNAVGSRGILPTR